MYVDKGRDKAVVFAFDIHPRFSEALYPVLLQGLDPQKQYTVKEINLMPGKKSNLPENGKTFSGDYLMKAGLNLFGRNQMSSCVIELGVN